MKNITFIKNKNIIINKIINRMSIFRSRNVILSNTLLDKNSFNSMTYRKELNLTTFRLDKNKKVSKKNTIDTPFYDGVLKNITKHNKFLKEQISILSTKNTNIKNFMRRIININNEENNKANIKTYLKEYNDLLSFNNKNMKIDVESDLNNYKNIENEINNKITQLLITKEEKEKIKFLLENDTQRKNNFIQIYKSNLKNIGNIQEGEKFRYLNDEILQTDIDNYLTKYLDIYRKNLLQTTQRWNRCKNKAVKNRKEIVELKKMLKNPKEIRKKQILEEQKNSNENSILSTEGDNDIFLMTFDDFEDDFEPGINEQDLMLNESIENNNNSNMNIKAIKEKEPKYNKINNRNLKNNNMNSNTIDNRTGNRINSLKKDLYYFPQNNYSKSILKEKTDSSRINSNRTISLNSISKLNFKQILFNKNAKYMKEEAHDFAVKKFEIENELELSKNDYENKNDIIIKDLKKDIKIFRNKIKKKKKLIKEFTKFCNEFYYKYKKYMNKNIDCNNGDE